MKYIWPIEITDGATFVSSSVAENDHTAWISTASYADGARCISTATHRIYESVNSANVGHNPTTDDGTWWVNAGPTNRWAMFDQSVGTQTTGTSPMSITVAPGLVESLALLDVQATSITVAMTNGATTIYSQTADMADNATLLDWYDYFFKAIEPKSSVIFTDLPPYSAGQITITVTNSSTAKVGTLAVGPVVDLGGDRYGARVGIIDYSVKTTDTFGVTTVTERAYAKRIETTLVVPSASVDAVCTALAAVRATPVVFYTDSNYQSLFAYGWARDWNVTIAYPTVCEMSLQIEGLS